MCEKNTETMIYSSKQKYRDIIFSSDVFRFILRHNRSYPLIVEQKSRYEKEATTNISTTLIDEVLIHLFNGDCFLGFDNE